MRASELLPHAYSNAILVYLLFYRYILYVTLGTGMNVKKEPSLNYSGLTAGEEKSMFFPRWGYFRRLSWYQIPTAAVITHQDCHELEAVQIGEELFGKWINSSRCVKSEPLANYCRIDSCRTGSPFGDAVAMFPRRFSVNPDVPASRPLEKPLKKDGITELCGVWKVWCLIFPLRPG